MSAFAGSTVGNDNGSQVPGLSSESESSQNLDQKIPQDHESEISVSETSEDEPETDSSYYSVNKFNFLFYLVYKIKYTDDGIPVEEENATMIEE